MTATWADPTATWADWSTSWTGATPGRLRLTAILLSVALVVVAASCDYQIARYRPDGSPVRWHPCTTVHYRINPAGMAVTERQRIIDAMAAASQATGIPVDYDGHTAATVADSGALFYARPFSDPPAPSDGFTEVRTGPAGNWWQSGEVIFNTLRPPPVDARTAAHEVGHLFGLAHPSSNAAAQVMGTHQPPYQPDDLAGLRAVGRQPGEC